MSRGLDQGILSAGIAHLDVGTPQIPFDVHIELLCDCSPFFDRLVKARTVLNITEEPIHLPDDDPKIFAELVSWMYRRELSSGLSSKRNIFLFNLWILAGKFEMPEVQNSVISVVGERMRGRPHAVFSMETIDYVYSHTLPESPLRLLVVDIYWRSVTGSLFLSQKQNLPRYFLEDLCCSLIEKKGNMDINDPISSIDRYFVPTVSLKDVVSDISDIPQLASPAQMKNRKIKRPSSRIRSSSPTLSSTSTATPDSKAASVDPGSVISQDMDRLHV